MTTEEIIDETIEFYKNNPRSIIGKQANYDACMYISEGTKCAVGRCLTKDTLKKVEKNLTALNRASIRGLLNKININTHDEIFKEEYRGHPYFFWVELQSLHDKSDNWEKSSTGNILSKEGEKTSAFLKQKWSKEKKNQKKKTK